MAKQEQQNSNSKQEAFDLPKNEDFIVSEGGPLNSILVRIRLKHKPLTLAFMAIVLTWCPLALISAFEKTFYSKDDSCFIYDVGTQIRFLIALPMLVLIRPVIDRWIRTVVNYFINTLLNGKTREDFLENQFATLMKWKGLRIAEVVILIVVVIFSLSPAQGGLVSGHQLGEKFWKFAPDSGYQTLSFAGNWMAFFSIPIFQFALLRWIWKYTLWVIFLFLLSRQKLDITATHPDLAGGLGVVFFAQKNFNLLFAAIGVSVSGELASQLIADPTTFDHLRNEAIAYIVLSIILILLPLIFFYKQLLNVKYLGYLEMSKAGHKLGDHFERKWLGDVIQEKFVDGPLNPSTAFDYSSLYLGLKDLRVMPVTVRDVAFLALTLCFPFIPLLLIHYPIAQLLQSIGGLLL